VFAAASAASVATSMATTAAMLVGIGVGSFAWFSILSTPEQARELHATAATDDPSSSCSCGSPR
jgi:hypothetical protein